MPSPGDSFQPSPLPGTAVPGYHMPPLGGWVDFYSSLV